MKITIAHSLPFFVVAALVLLSLYLTSLYNYLLFHSLIEIFSIVVAFSIFAIAWNARAFMEDHYLLFLGVAYFFVGLIDLLHTLAYKGMGVFPDASANLPTQLWIAARYLEVSALLAAPLFIGRKISISILFLPVTAVAALLGSSIFIWKIFPDCFLEPGGLTPFKKGSEYIIALLLVGASRATHI